MPNDPKAARGFIELLREGLTTLKPVEPHDLGRILPDVIAAGGIDDADLESRRTRFEEGRMTLKELKWLGELYTLRGRILRVPDEGWSPNPVGRSR